MRVIVGTGLAVFVLVLAALAYSEQDALVTFVSVNIGSMPAYASALAIITWVGLGTILFIPNTILFVTSGTLFGFWWAFTFNLIGFGVGSTLAFLISRYGFYDFVRQRAHSMLQTFNLRFSNAGWKAVAAVRLTPIFPSFAVNYLLGITHVRFFDYVWASILFTVPACLILTFVGDASVTLLLEGVDRDSLVKLGGLIVIGIIIIAGAIIRRRATNAQ
ncbi:MAG: TVP38/TMEM64 family protein [Pseudohongiellaceae bacterium]